MSKIHALIILVTSALSHSVGAKDVEIMLANNLDGYCLDIVGNGNHITPDKGLQVHTCYRYQGSIGDDQAFDDTKFAEHRLYLSKFNVCIQATELVSRSPLELHKCSEAKEIFQVWTTR